MGNMALEDQASNLRYQMGGMMAPEQIGVGMNVSQFNQAVTQQQLMNINGAMNAPMQLAAQMRGERVAGASRTSTGTNTPSAFETFTDLVGAAGNTYRAASSAGAGK